MSGDNIVPGFRNPEGMAGPPQLNVGAAETVDLTEDSDDPGDAYPEYSWPVLHSYRQLMRPDLTHTRSPSSSAGSSASPSTSSGTASAPKPILNHAILDADLSESPPPPLSGSDVMRIANRAAINRLDLMLSDLLHDPFRMFRFEPLANHNQRADSCQPEQSDLWNTVTCASCGIRGHYASDHCNTCGSLAHRTWDYCEHCGQIGHVSLDHCEICDVLSCGDWRHCDQCGRLGHSSSDHCFTCVMTLVTGHSRIAPAVTNLAMPTRIVATREGKNSVGPAALLDTVRSNVYTTGTVRFVVETRNRRYCLHCTVEIVPGSNEHKIQDCPFMTHKVGCLNKTHYNLTCQAWIRRSYTNTSTQTNLAEYLSQTDPTVIEAGNGKGKQKASNTELVSVPPNIFTAVSSATQTAFIEEPVSLEWSMSEYRTWKAEQQSNVPDLGRSEDDISHDRVEMEPETVFSRARLDFLPEGDDEELSGKLITPQRSKKRSSLAMSSHSVSPKLSSFSWLSLSTAGPLGMSSVSSRASPIPSDVPDSGYSSNSTHLSISSSLWDSSDSSEPSDASGSPESFIVPNLSPSVSSSASSSAGQASDATSLMSSSSFSVPSSPGSSHSSTPIPEMTTTKTALQPLPSPPSTPSTINTTLDEESSPEDASSPTQSETDREILSNSRTWKPHLPRIEKLYDNPDSTTSPQASKKRKLLPQNVITSSERGIPLPNGTHIPWTTLCLFVVLNIPNHTGELVWKGG
ncbi:hypothetical protein AUEXF2481DRAFT_32973 [Aureobasidium subglaciale EXF-2481]|uniref:Uncharacterized protein n=1 Tax=Aureobasidium subglaciale (strain EXF-2481) TaxID=1043005 RepID=A0A074Y1D6_AURSE|nr:uncharacterized protein AUEXF2481DRAFT_32973 [Aureobasidium subglaciale EXF-2481]KEQ91598.1 hypothetical protein AUEXF2481DRAFT_32973 [Aureobasidium subglaciale EXF-2481]